MRIVLFLQVIFIGLALADSVSSDVWCRQNQSVYWIAAEYGLYFLVSPPETHFLGFRTKIWRVSWTYLRKKLLANILAGSISRSLLPVYTVPVPSPRFSRFGLLLTYIYIVHAAHALQLHTRTK